jgi:hypothetical protein
MIAAAPDRPLVQHPGRPGKKIVVTFVRYRRRNYHEEKSYHHLSGQHAGGTHQPKH